MPQTLTLKTEDNNIGWKNLRTLGGKAKPFKYLRSSDGGLRIRRQFVQSDEIVQVESAFSANELKQIDDFVQKSVAKNPQGVPLANNMEKLRHGTEAAGIGSFIYRQLRAMAPLTRQNADAQAASHLAAIQVDEKHWKLSNPYAKRCMLFLP